MEVASKYQVALPSSWQPRRSPVRRRPAEAWGTPAGSARLRGRRLAQPELHTCRAALCPGEGPAQGCPRHHGHRLDALRAAGDGRIPVRPGTHSGAGGVPLLKSHLHQYLLKRKGRFSFSSRYMAMDTCGQVCPVLGRREGVGVVSEEEKEK